MSVLDSLAEEPKLGLDTESDPFHRYFEKICLIQISTRTDDYFFDPLEHELPDELRSLFIDPKRTLVIHGADYDVRCLRRSFGIVLGKIFDTSIAGQMLGLEGVGLKSLLETQLGVVIDKSQQRSDWGKRPLSLEQLTYARADTRNLVLLADKLSEQLDRIGRLSWLEEECEEIRHKMPVERVFDPQACWKLKGAKNLRSDLAKQVLKTTFVWREERAQSVDVPPFRILRSDTLIRLATQFDNQGLRLLSRSRLKRLKLLPRSIDLDGLMDALESMPDEPVVVAKPRGKSKVALGFNGKERVRRLKKRRTEWSKNLSMDPGFLLPGALLERIAKAAPETLRTLSAIEGMTGWRASVFGGEILDTVRL